MSKFHLNLLNRTDSIIDYKINTFPDGEKQLVLLGDFLKYTKERYTNILTRISSIEDLFILNQAIDIFSRYGMRLNVFITYLLGQRNDRVMSFGTAVNLDVVLKMLRDKDSMKLTLIEPHNIDAIFQSNFLVDENYSTTLIILKKHFTEKDVILVFPDKGAIDRYDNYYGNIGFWEKIVCNKQRIERFDGKTYISLELVNVNNINLDNNKPFVVIDDLCDGGGTFIKVAEELNKKYKDRKKYLIVTHAVNKEGIYNVSKYYDKVYITDSYCDWQTIALPSNVEISHISKLINN